MLKYFTFTISDMLKGKKKDWVYLDKRKNKTEAYKKQTANSVNQKMNELHVSNADSNEVFSHIIWK